MFLALLLCQIISLVIICHVAVFVSKLSKGGSQLMSFADCIFNVGSARPATCPRRTRAL
jgi:hypothetical protein